MAKKVEKIDPRELILAETIMNKLIGIQESKQIYEELSTLKKKTLKMTKNEIERVSKIVASKVHKFCMNRKNSGKPLTPKMINERVERELENIQL